MSVLVVGLSHRSADLALLERLAVPAEDLGKALRSLLGLEHVLEAVVLSTCNRVEVYASVSRFHPGLQEVRTWLAERGDIHPQDLDALEYSYHDDRAAAHLFAVAAGIHSMVVGEQQIALQVKQAMETVLIVGAGKMGGLTADRLVDHGVQRALVWNRSADKATRLAARVGGEVVPDGELAGAIAASDLVVCTTGASMPVLDLDLVSRAVARREDLRPLVLLDLAMPRNVDPACEDLPSVTVVDIADVREEADRTVTGEVVAEAEAIVDEEAAAFLAWTRAVAVGPTIRTLRDRAEAVRQAELERLSNRLGDLDERQREAVEAVTRGILNTLLHEPTVRLKELADAGGAEVHAHALRELFDLDEDA
jgi:glutamyl-tRNA reductase